MHTYPEQLKSEYVALQKARRTFIMHGLRIPSDLEQRIAEVVSEYYRCTDGRSNS